MSSSDTDSFRILEVQGGDPVVQIVVVDSQLEEVARGWGTLRERLPTGLYGVRFIAGGRVAEVPVHLEPSYDPMVVPSAKLEIDSPAPIERSRGFDTQTMSLARSHSRQVDVDISREFGDTNRYTPLARQQEPSQLFVFVNGPRPSDGLTRLHGISIEVNPTTFSRQTERWPYSELLPLDRLERGASQQDFTAPEAEGCVVQLPHGQHVLHIDTGPFGWQALTTFTCPGWQTQVFLTRRQHNLGAESFSLPDLTTAAILMAPVDRGFNPEDPQLWTTEALRHQLASGQPLPVEVVSRLAATLSTSDERARHPMLALYLVHLMLRGGEQELELERIRQLIREYDDLLIYQPDWAYLNHLFVSVPFRIWPRNLAPPTLLATWEYVVRASLVRSDFAPTKAPVVSVAAEAWRAGPWLNWDVMVLERRPEAEDTRSAGEYSDLESVLWQVFYDSYQVTDGDLRRNATGTYTTTLERNLIAYLRGGYSRDGPIVNPVEERTRRLTAANRVLETTIARRGYRSRYTGELAALVEALEVPVAAIHIAAYHLLGRLKGGSR